MDYAIYVLHANIHTHIRFVSVTIQKQCTLVIQVMVIHFVKGFSVFNERNNISLHYYRLRFITEASPSDNPLKPSTNWQIFADAIVYNLLH